MMKKLLSVWLIMTVLLFSTTAIYADDNVKGVFFLKNIVINGEEIVNYNLQYPFFLYEDMTYFPLTPDMGEICGFSAEMDWESRTLKIAKTESTLANIKENWAKNYGDNVTAVSIDNATWEYENTFSLNNYDVLVMDGVVYIPLKAMCENDEFGWSVYFDPYFGISISTVPGVPAMNLVDTAELNYNKGLTNYIQSKNSKNGLGVTQNLVFLFHRASDVYDIDEKLLIAVAEKESTFNPACVSGSGAVGLMQIMPATAAGYDVGAEMLYDIKVNINFGAMYLKTRLENHDGDLVKSLSAYNQGSGAVRRGNYTTAYASRVLGAHESLTSYLLTNNYGVID